MLAIRPPLGSAGAWLRRSARGAKALRLGGTRQRRFYFYQTRAEKIKSLQRYSILFGVGGSIHVVYSAYKMHRLEGETVALHGMLDAGTTIAELQDMAAAGKPLPPVVVVQGELSAFDDLDHGMAIRQLLLTRLSVDAYRIDNKPIRRYPKRRESNVAIGRREAEGLRFIGLEGGSAAMILPALDLEVSDALFLAANEENLTGRIDHMSKFVVKDDEPPGDLPKSFLRSCEKKLDRLRPANAPAPALWRFDPEDYYDGGRDMGQWSYFSVFGLERRGLPSFDRVEYITPKELIKRAEIAADENNKFSKLRPEPLARDTENGFRLVELAVPLGSPVTIVAQPRLISKSLNKHPIESIASGSDLGIALCAPPSRLLGGERGLGGHKFRMRVLQGHTIDNLVLQRERFVAEQVLRGPNSILMGLMATAFGIFLRFVAGDSDTQA
eukprot:SAG31_NODE_589_length_13808_cov_3.896710_3_plen_441_part_00